VTDTPDDKAKQMAEYRRQCVTVNDTDISGEFARLSGDQDYWNNRFARAYESHAKTKLARERTEALVQLEVRRKLKDEGEKVVEKLVEARVRTDERVKSMEDAELDADVMLVKVKGVCEAIKTKREMIISLGAHIRDDKKPDMAMKARGAR
jgi:hypothetical protein